MLTYLCDKNTNVYVTDYLIKMTIYIYCVFLLLLRFPNVFNFSGVFYWQTYQYNRLILQRSTQ